MAKITPCMENGKAALAHSLRNGLGFGSTEFHVLRPNGTVVAGFLYHFIRQQSYRRAAESEMTGSVGQKRVPTSFLETTELPLPPLAEQKRIVTKDEELLTEVNNVRSRLDKLYKTIKAFRQSVLAAACSGRLTEDWRLTQPRSESAALLLDRLRKKRIATVREDTVNVSAELPDSWTWSCFGDLLDSIRGGSTAPPELERTDYPAIKQRPAKVRGSNKCSISFTRSEPSGRELHC